MEPGVDQRQSTELISLFCEFSHIFADFFLAGRQMADRLCSVVQDHGKTSLTETQKETIMKKLRNLAAAMLLCLPVTLFAGGTVDINTADKETLMSLRGVGESFAERIIEYREQNGGFKAVQELTNIRGIGQTLVEKNREMLTVGASPE